MKVEKTRKIYKRRKHNKELKHTRQPWNSNSLIDQQESRNEEDNVESQEPTIQSTSQQVPNDFIQFFNNPQTLLEFKQFQEYLKVKDSMRSRSNSDIKDLPISTEKSPVTPPTTPILTKSSPTKSELDLLSSIEEDEESLDFSDDNYQDSKIRNNASF